MLGHKTSLNKLKRMEIISDTFFDHSAIRLEINYRRKTEKKQKTQNMNTWTLNNMPLNNQWVSEEIKKEI